MKAEQQNSTDILLQADTSLAEKSEHVIEIDLVFMRPFSLAIKSIFSQIQTCTQSL